MQEQQRHKMKYCFIQELSKNGDKDKRNCQTNVYSLNVNLYYSPIVEGKEGIPSLKGSSRRVHNDVPKRVCDIPTTSMLNKLSWREEVSMAHTHDPHFLPLTIFVHLHLILLASVIFFLLKSEFWVIIYIINCILMRLKVNKWNQDKINM